MREKKNFEKVALDFTRWIGSPASIALHTVAFVVCFFVVWVGIVRFDEMLLLLTTVVSLEAIYLALFIQMTVNYTTVSLDEMSEDVDEIQEDIDEIQKDVDEIQEDVDEIQKDVDEMSEEDVEEEKREEQHQKTLSDIQADLRRLMEDIDRLRKEEDIRKK